MLPSLGRLHRVPGPASAAEARIPYSEEAGSLTFLGIVAQRRLQQGHAGLEGHLLAAATSAALPLVLALAVLQVLLILRPLLQLLGPALLCGAQPLQRGHLLQQLQLGQQVHVAGHGHRGSPSPGGASTVRPGPGARAGTQRAGASWWGLCHRERNTK